MNRSVNLVENEERYRIPQFNKDYDGFMCDNQLIIYKILFILSF